MIEDLVEFPPADAAADGAGDGTPTAVVRVHVQPGAGRTAVAGRHGDALKLRVGAPPEKGRANDACAALLAEVTGAKAADVELVSGATSREKRFRITGVERETLLRRLEEAVGDGGNARPGRGVGQRRR